MALRACLAAGLLAIAASAACADIGPKPTIDIAFTFDKPGLSIRLGALYECPDRACKSSRLLPVLGPQRFICDASSCGGQAYGFSRYVWIEVALSDGRTVRSLPFAKLAFDARYKAKVAGSGLQITSVAR